MLELGDCKLDGANDHLDALVERAIHSRLVRERESVVLGGGVGRVESLAPRPVVQIPDPGFEFGEEVVCRVVVYVLSAAPPLSPPDSDRVPCGPAVECEIVLGSLFH